MAINSSNRSIGSWLSNKATEAINKIDNPIVRSGVGSIVNALDPRILGAGRINVSDGTNVISINLSGMIAEHQTCLMSSIKLLRLVLKPQVLMNPMIGELD